ncbi:3' exoribonuclease family, domain 1-domain-containing protein [Cantharellus anzutake]|uniref:3' exoribonuclease family, domain 1-domain-containing protein n=1 Tax=Cantharellus anzutake TaxID=1750568 RepID=UPI0019082D45|nr:3' exoribonuclease family, domain 1-domain-containing protein [Cantharellus anzutake]KAF8336946.1 3' exoribonuclease family, domain 1-domain-containing protein [Cantharellus anzutake]
MYSFDRRRVNGPENTYPPAYESTKEAPSPTRRQGRKPHNIRPFVFLKVGLITQAHGSAYIETEKLKIACAVYGPRQNKNSPYTQQGALNVEVKIVPFATKRRRIPIKDVEDRSLSMQIHQCLAPSLRLDLFPKSIIDVFITVLEMDGEASCIASGSIAASAALADAGIEMFGLVAACSACTFPSPSRDGGGSSHPPRNDDDTTRMDEDDQADHHWKGVWLDPNEEEGSLASGTVVMACMPALGTVTNLKQSGCMTSVQVSSCLELCMKQCADIHLVISKTLLESARARQVASTPAEKA